MIFPPIANLGYPEKKILVINLLGIPIEMAKMKGLNYPSSWLT